MKYKDSQLVFVFPGQGAQRRGMLNDIAQAFPDVRAEALALDQVWQQSGHDFSLLEAISEGHDPSGRELVDTALAQPVLGLVEAAAVRAFRRRGLVSAWQVGHSYGELVALWCGGVMDDAQLLELSAIRGTAMAGACNDRQGGMLAVKAEQSEATALIEGIAKDAIAVANFNAPHQQVISGDHIALVAVEQRARNAAIACARLRVAGAFHSPLMHGAQLAWTSELDSAVLMAPRASTVMSTISAQYYEPSVDAVRALLARQLTSPVRFVEAVERLYDAGARIFLEVGPGQTLCRLIDAILENRPHTCLTVDPSGSDPQEHAAKVWQALVSSPAFQGCEGTHLSALQRDILSSNQAVVESFFAQQRLLIEKIASWPVEEREKVAEEIVRANRSVSEAFLKAQSAGAGVVSVGSEFTEIELPSLTRQPVDGGSEIESFLRAQIAEVTGFAQSRIGRDTDLAAELGLDSISTLEIYFKLVERYPAAAGLGPAVRACSRFGEVVEVLERGLANEKEALSPSAQPSVALKPKHESHLSWILRLLSEQRKQSVGTEQLDESFRSLGIDLFDLENVCRRIRKSEPKAELLGQVLLNAQTPRQLVDWVDAVRSSDVDGVQVEPEPSGDLDPVLRYRMIYKETAWTVKSAPSRLLVVATGKGPTIERLVARGGSTSLRLIESGRHLQSMDGRLFSFEDTEALRDTLVHAARSHGVEGVVLAAGEPDAGDFVPHCTSLFAIAKALEAAQRGAVRSMPLGVLSIGDHAARNEALRAMIRCLGLEWQGASARIVIAHHGLPPAFDERVLSELFQGPSGRSLHFDAQTQTLSRLGIVPCTDLSEEPSLLPRRNEPVLFVGGADGIAAELAVALSARTGCCICVVGRTPWPESVPFEGVPDGAALRNAIRESFEGSLFGPALVQATGEALALAKRQRALLRTRARIVAGGGQLVYERADASDLGQLDEAVRRMTSRVGPMRGLVVAAGKLRDGSVSHKSVTDFEDVIHAKLRSAIHARQLLIDAPLRSVLLYSSLAGLTGNEGQIDYSAANGALIGLAQEWSESASYPVRALMWSVWTESGFASEMIRKQLVARGMTGIVNTVGARLALDELVSSSPQTAVALCPRSVVSYIAPDLLIDESTAFRGRQ